MIVEKRNTRSSGDFIADPITTPSVSNSTGSSVLNQTIDISSDDNTAPLLNSTHRTDVASLRLISSSPTVEPPSIDLEIPHRSGSRQEEDVATPRTPTERRITPATRSEDVVPSSEYYTAAWGSPYELSPTTDLHSISTALSEQITSGDDYLSSPETSFDLDHLIPSRFGGLPQTEAHLPGTSPNSAFSGAVEQTPRPPIDRWVSLPKREAPEKPQWWSESSSGSDREESKSDQRPNSAQGDRRVRGHKKRRENKTLDQQAYLELVREQHVDSMSGLAASRWASTPVQEEERQLGGTDAEHAAAEQKTRVGKPATVEDEVTEQESSIEQPAADTIVSQPPEQPGPNPVLEKDDILSANDSKAGRPLDTASNTTSVQPSAAAAPLSWAEDVEASMADSQPSAQNTTEETATGRSDSINGRQKQEDKPDAAELPRFNLLPDSLNSPKPDDDHPDMIAAETRDAPPPFRLEPPRLKRRITWRGKNCMINIPSLDFNALGLPLPMTLEEARQRIAHFDAATVAMGSEHFADPDERTAHVVPIYPDERESRTWPSGKKMVVLLPDLNAWRNYENALVEAKLAALGVGLSDEASSPQPEDMSRQTSSTFPATLSPPIPTCSANSARPAFIRGHSHTLSVASPITPGNGPFGHMHRHSTFHGFSPLQAQDMARQAGLSAPPGFSPVSPFNIPPFPQVASPAQLNILRHDLGNIRGPGSPLSQNMTPEPIDYQRQKLQNLLQQQQPPLPPSQLLSRGYVEQISALPELPEDEDEEELSDPTPYVPPHKRAQINEDIVVPTPRHRHNISEGLEREVLQAERGRLVQEKSSDSPTSRFGQAPRLFGQVSDQVPPEKDPLSGDYSVLESGHSHKRSGSRFNVTAAPSFTFNPTATFKPSASKFTFGAASASRRQANTTHKRQVSSGTLNVTAPEFKPSASIDGPALPTSDFSFSAQGPAFSAVVPSTIPSITSPRNAVDELPSIFGKINIPDIVKPARTSKAVAIVRPDEASNMAGWAIDVEDADGRLIRGDERPKRSRKSGSDIGDEVPQFAVPSPEPPLPTVPVLPSQPETDYPADEMTLPEKKADSTLEQKDETMSGGDQQLSDNQAASEGPIDTPLSKQNADNSSLSALAHTWQPPSIEELGSRTEADGADTISDREDGEVLSDHEANKSYAERQLDLDATREPPAPDGVVFPSFDEIDAVMQQLNAADDAQAARGEDKQDEFAPPEGVQYLSTWPPRSDAPSPSPKRQQHPYQQSPPLSQPQIDGVNNIAFNGDPWAGINRLNKATGPPSDWSDMLTPADDNKLQARGAFFDSRVDDVVGRVLADRLRPFEDALQNIQLALRRSSPNERLPSKRRSASAVDSDADDEDDSDLPRQRPISRGRDDKLGHIKALVLEALREQSPQHSQTAYDIADLHGVLADMKMSFARAASSGLELDDIRAVVEEAVARRPSQEVPASSEDPDNAMHKQELSKLEAKLNETLTSALEQANRMHEVQQREAETRRMLKLAEEELRLLREDNEDGSSRSRAFESERVALLGQVDEAKDAQAKAKDHSDNLRAENEALQATLDEYRMSSKKWRETAEEHKVERESLQSTVQALERQMQDNQESGSAIKRRLERLHSDMAAASGQLASEKQRWKTREEGFGAQCETLKADLAKSVSEKLHLEERVRVLQIRAAEVDTAKEAFNGLHVTNSSLDDMIRGLRGELKASQALASQFEHDFKEAQENGRIEVQRVRANKELEIEAANHKSTILRAELEGELARVRTELDSAKLDTNNAIEKHRMKLEEEVETRNAHAEKANKTYTETLEEIRRKHDGVVRELTNQHRRSLAHAIEDKERSEYLLNERLSLADAKLEHFQDKILHLRECVEIAKSAAQAAAMSAQGTKTAAPTTYRSTGPPEKISPQALRESILVLQEQLQDREMRIEKLQQQLKTHGPAKIKERDSEIAWLRELLTVRGEELTELVNALSKPAFDRDAVRDAAIRIRANLQMEQQEKERTGTPMSAGQAIASLSNFATPKAAQLTSAFNKWRTSMESSALKSRSPSASANRSSTPSRAPSAAKGTYGPSGLMTPPTSNVRSSPSPEATSTVPAPKLSARRESKAKRSEENSESQGLLQSHDAPSTPNLFGTNSYDDDAEDRVDEMTNLDDDDLNIADSQPPAFRSLEDELDEPVDGGSDG